MTENFWQLVKDLLILFSFWIPFIVVLVLVGARDKWRRRP